MKVLTRARTIKFISSGTRKNVKRITVVLTKISGTNGLLPKITGGRLIAGKY